MKKIIGYMLLLLLMFISNAFTQGRVSPDSYAERGGEPLDSLQQRNPELATFEKRLSVIRLEIRKILEEYKSKQLSKEKAKEKLIPLLKERQEIIDDYEYIAELMLSLGRPRRGF